MNESPYITEVNADNFEQIVIQGSHERPVLVDFWASWCQPCQLLMPVLAQLADEYQGKFVLAKLNTEENQPLAGQYGIRSIPNVKLFIGGKEVDEFAGALPESAIREFLDKHLPRESDSRVDAALQAFTTGHTADALEMLTQAHSADPDNARITIAIAQVNAASGDIGAAESALDSLPPAEQENPEVVSLRNQLFFQRDAPTPGEVEELQQRVASDGNDSDARYRLAIARIQQQQYEQAIELLLALMAVDRTFKDDAARKALLRLFDMLGEDPLVAQARRRLFNMMH